MWTRVGGWLLLVMMLVGASWSVFLPMAQAQNLSPDLPIATAPTDRPHLLLTQSYIQQTLQPRLTAATPAWERFLAYVNSSQPEADAAEHPLEVTRSLAVAYLVTGEKSYADRAGFSLIVMLDALEAHPAMLGSGVWDETFTDYLAGIAVAYDWLYPALRETDRAALVQVMQRGMAILNDPVTGDGRAYVLAEDGSYRFVSYEHWGARLIWATAAVGMALWGEDPAAPEWVEYARVLLTRWMIPSLDDLSGGAWAEGLTYGWEATWANLQSITAFWTMFGENYLDDSRWWYDRLGYDLFAVYPSLQEVSTKNLPIWGYPSIIGDSARYSESALYGRAQDMLLTSLFAGTDHAGWMNWFLAQPSGNPPHLRDWMAVEEFLWRDESAEGGFIPPWRIWFTNRTGHVFLRSGWDNLADDSTTYISFNAGDRFATHQFFDQGNLTLVRGDDELVVRSGVYSGETDHDANYYGRSIAANVPLICDLAENFDGIRPNRERQVWLNDCGQRAIVPPSAVNNFQRADNLSLYETGTVLRFSEEGSLHYVRADLTPAYNSTVYSSLDNRPKVSEVLREFIYLRPDRLIIHDRIMTTDPSFTVMNPFHTLTEGQIEGAWVRVEVGNSALYLRGLAPQNTVKVAQTFSTEGESLPPNGNRFETQPYGGYAVQFTASDSRQNHFFLTILQVGEAKTIIPPAASFVTGDGIYGVQVDDWQIMFDDDPQNITQTSFSVLEGIANVLMTGLTPLGLYDVTLTTGEIVRLQADDAGTLLIGIQLSGEIRLQQP